MARANYGAQFLRIEPRRKIPQSDEVARDDGQVAAFGLDPWRGSRGGNRWRGGRACGCSSSFTSRTSPTKRIPLRGSVRMRR